jgi:hypothetical protein
MHPCSQVSWVNPALRGNLKEDVKSIHRWGWWSSSHSERSLMTHACTSSDTEEGGWWGESTAEVGVDIELENRSKSEYWLHHCFQRLTRTHAEHISSKSCHDTDSMSSVWIVMWNGDLLYMYKDWYSRHLLGICKTADKLLKSPGRCGKESG